MEEMVRTLDRMPSFDGSEKIGTKITLAALADERWLQWQKVDGCESRNTSLG